jgi:lipid-binding SYLF domain-containing protein
MRILTVLSFLAVLAACVSTGEEKSVAEQRQEIMQMHNRALTNLYKEHPYAKKEISSAPGYAVFSNAQLNVIFAAVGGGYGVVHSNLNGKNTFMQMGEAGLGLGLGVKDFRAVFVFKTRQAMDDFINDGWAFGAEADAAAKASDKGGEYSGSTTIGDITIYQMTDAGLAAQATVKGTKYWKNDKLN